MKLSEYLLDRIFSLICMLVAALVLLALLWLIETPAVFILFAEVLNGLYGKTIIRIETIS